MELRIRGAIRRGKGGYVFPPRDTGSDGIADSIVDEVKLCPVCRVEVDRIEASHLDELGETIVSVVRSCAKEQDLTSRGRQSRAYTLDVVMKLVPLGVPRMRCANIHGYSSI